MHHGQVQADRRFGEARHLHAQESAALRAAFGLRGRRLVDLGPIPPLCQPKGRVLRRVPLRPSPPDTAALDSGGAAAALTSLPATAVHHDVGPMGSPESFAEASLRSQAGRRKRRSPIAAASGSRRRIPRIRFPCVAGLMPVPTLPRPGPGRQTGSCELLEETARVPAPVDCTVVGQAITARRRMTTRRPHCDAFPNGDQPGPAGVTAIFVTPPEAIVRLDPPQCARLAFA
jgi:hypothetical protein